MLQIDTILDENTLYLCPPEVASNPEMLCRYAALQTQFAQMEKRSDAVSGYYDGNA